MPPSGSLIGAICGVYHDIQTIVPFALMLVVALALTAGLLFRGLNFGVIVLAFVAVAVILAFPAFLGALGASSAAAVCGTASPPGP